MAAYPFQQMEPKWQAHWLKNKTFRTPDAVDSSKPKFYVLDMFPYPSGAGLHVGHPEGYTATDIVARYKRMKGFAVLHPMGWDSFGLPAEQYAIETGTHPRATTYANIDRFRAQLQSLGFSYDWDREIATTDADYYRWTQWIFLKLLERGLAYEAEVPVNWCPALGTVLANEEVIDGKSERGGHPVIRKPMRQWMLKITAYAERLLDDLKQVDWPESIKEMQRNWIGKSEGAVVTFQVAGASLPIEVFTTRPDTLFGATYMVLAPEHPLVDRIATPACAERVRAYQHAAARKSEFERTELQKTKTGEFTGAFAINPVNEERIPIWIADYVLWGYGTGAIMAVPGHDDRDYAFARTFRLPIREVVSGGDLSVGPFTGDGAVVNSANAECSINGLRVPEAKAKITAWLQGKGLGAPRVNYKLRDWLFSRQRYWGEPIPVVHCATCGVVPVPERDLPLTLPEMKDFSPTGEAEPPLAKAADWVNCACPKCGGRARRETNTMPQWAGSCWYYLRFIDPRNTRALVASDLEKRWMPVDLYVGGAEHAVLHLLYARFWHKVLFDAGVVSTPEPFRKLVNQGMILGEMEFTAYRDTEGRFVSAEEGEGRTDLTAARVDEDQVEKRGDVFVLAEDPRVRVNARAHKMSKSRGNVINPDDVVKVYGADSLRLYEMFMGPLEAVKPWNMRGVEGVHRFLSRVWRLVVDEDADQPGAARLSQQVVAREPTRDELRALHATIRKVTEDVEGMRFNTAIASMMEFLNEAQRWADRPRSMLETLVLLLSPFAPHLAEELWARLGHERSLAYEPWPEYDPALLLTDTLDVVVQVNGKLRGRVTVAVGAEQAAVLTAARAAAGVQAHLSGKTIRKEVYVPGKLVNFVVG